jgi:hypothetical protein
LRGAAGRECNQAGFEVGQGRDAGGAEDGDVFEHGFSFIDLMSLELLHYRLGAWVLHKSFSNWRTVQVCYCDAAYICAVACGIVSRQLPVQITYAVWIAYDRYGLAHIPGACVCEF